MMMDGDSISYLRKRVNAVGLKRCRIQPNCVIVEDETGDESVQFFYNTKKIHWYAYNRNGLVETGDDFANVKDCVDDFCARHIQQPKGDKMNETVKTITRVMQYCFNVTGEEFQRDLSEVLEMDLVGWYVGEMFDRMRANPAAFFCNLDDGAKGRFVEVALKHYQK